MEGEAMEINRSGSQPSSKGPAEAPWFGSMHREMRDISGDLRERADQLVRQMVAEQARFRAELADIKREEAIRRQRLQTALQAVQRLMNVLSVQHALHRGLKSAVAALDILGPAQASATEGKKEKREISKAMPATSP
jgi:hypothetical protein